MSSQTKAVFVMILVSFLLVVLLVIAGVALLLAEPEETAAEPTIPVSPLKPTPGAGASPTFHIISTLPPSPTPSPTPMPTETPAPTNTPEPTAVPPTNTPQPAQQQQQQPAQQQPAEPEPPAPSGPVVSSKGLQTDYFKVDKTEFAVNEQIWFNFRLLNPTDQAVSFGFLGVSVSQDGQNLGDLFHTSYQEHTLNPLDAAFAEYRDWTIIDRAGTFQLHLTICYPDIATCSNGGQWENISNPITVTVR